MSDNVEVAALYEDMRATRIRLDRAALRLRARPDLEARLVRAERRLAEIEHARWRTVSDFVELTDTFSGVPIQVGPAREVKSLLIDFLTYVDVTAVAFSDLTYQEVVERYLNEDT